MTLEERYLKQKEDYKKLGYDEDSWQWKDEGIVYCIMDYLSSMGEFTDKDLAFAKREGIEAELDFAAETLNEN